MKRTINLLMIIFLILGSYNCSDDFLDRNHPGTMSFDKIYKTKQDFDAALAGCYSSFTDQANYLLFLGECPSDNIHFGRYNISTEFMRIKSHIYTASHSYLDSYWSFSYRTIQRVNLLLEKLPDSPLDDQSQKLMSAEAKFLRAFSYFQLLRIYGGVPLYDSYTDLQDTYDVPRASVEEVKNLILADLNEVKNIDSYRSPGYNALGRATSIAAKTLMAKTYLWVKDFANAETILADIVQNNGGLDLEDLSVLYDPEKPDNKEIIFSINYERVSGFSFPLVRNLMPLNTPPGMFYPNVTVTSGSGIGNIEPYVLNKFSPEDKRLDLVDSVIFSSVGVIDTSIVTLKYFDPLTDNNFLSGANLIVLRYADVLLMYAEALNENGKTAQAYTYINMVRTRAGIQDLPSGYTKEQMFQALADERQKEFILEFDRWFDLVFRGLEFIKKEMNAYIPNAQLESYRNYYVRDNCLLFPIPESQLQVKPILTQNPDY